ncbi:NBR1 autophagy cargo receptor a isoform X2 [Pundamilia nyererei]|uniref:NBR1 autophagy cargo receptor a isoform X2 n=1 Tax=Pundamilia nyererei TaxID=303518 RepID=A0A9Y3V872_9CICH|nr:PREDICTED: next to BRCA1 gene 1 protein isoform X2 [Pundamilia nyererei]
MGLPVTIKVNFRGNVKRFLAQDMDKLEWEAVEVWIKASFGINHFQVKYFDEDNEEICINSQDEYEEAIKSAEKQGNQLHMNVYKMKGQACGGPLKTEVKELKGDLRPAPPYPSRVKTVDKGTQVTPEREAVAVKDNKGNKPDDEPPPMWFRSYMEKFKDEVVKEVVERMCSDFSVQCCTHKSPEGPPEAIGAIGGIMGPKPGPSTSNGSLGYTPNCSSCNKLTSEGAYKCSVCPSCILCEMCRHSHDPSHNLVRTKTPLSIPEHGMSGELRGPGVSHTSLVPTMAALFLDENLPDGTNLEPGTKFIKYWKMKNTGSICWTSETKLVFMWGNLSLASEEKREVPVPLLPPGHVGMVSVALVAPVTDGTYTSHWRLAHCGSQFGPRVWCSIVVKQRDKRTGLRHQRKRLKKDLRPPKEEMKPEEKEARAKKGHTGFLAGLFSEDYYFPPVDFMTAQDLLSFELLDLNFADDLEKVPHNTPADLTPCISPLPYCTVVLDKSSPSPKKEETEISGVRKLFGRKLRNLKEVFTPVAQEEERDDEISGAQFLCETVMRSLALEEAPDHRPPRRLQRCGHEPKVVSPVLNFEKTDESEETDEFQEGNEIGAVKPETSALPTNIGLNWIAQKEETRPISPPEPENKNLRMSSHHNNEDKGFEACDGTQNVTDDREEKEEDGNKGEDWDEISSQISSVSSDDYSVILPDCFDTSRPLGESMYSSAMSQPGTGAAALASDKSDVEQEEEEESIMEPGRDALLGERQELTEVASAEDSLGNAGPPLVTQINSSVNQMPCASQTVDEVTLTPEVVPFPDPLLPPPTLYSPRSEALYLADDPSSPACDPNEPHQPRVHLNVSSGLSRSAGSAASAFETYNPRPSNALQPRGQGGITEGFVKGALSVAASAYKALFTGPSCSVERGIDPATTQGPSKMDQLLEMGFRDQRMNRRLLKKHFYSLEHTVDELVQLAENRRNRYNVT